MSNLLNFVSIVNKKGLVRIFHLGKYWHYFYSLPTLISAHLPLGSRYCPTTSLSVKPLPRLLKKLNLSVTETFWSSRYLERNVFFNEQECWSDQVMLGGGLPLATQVSDTSGPSRKVCSLNCEWKTGGTSRKAELF